MTTRPEAVENNPARRPIQLFSQRRLARLSGKCDFVLRREGLAHEAESKKKHGVWDPYAGVDYNLTLRPFQSRLQNIYHGQLYARVDIIPQSETLDLASADR